MAHAPRLSAILAVGTNGALGRAGKLPWNYPEDRAHFARTTRGHAVIMGRRTWDEEGRALPERTNIIVSRTFVPPPDRARGTPPEGSTSVRIARSLDDALAIAWSVDDEPFVIGGAVLFTAAMPRVTRVYLTEIPEAPEADVFFHLDRTGFTAVSERVGERGARFLVLERQAR